MPHRRRIVSAPSNWKVLRVSNNVFASTLARAIEVEGSTQAIAHMLCVPETTLLRWREGRADMPVRAFRALIEFLSAAEMRYAANMAETPASAPEPSPEGLEFRIGNLTAQCERCQCTEFRRVRPDEPLRMTSSLLCAACGHEILHGDLLVKLGQTLIDKKRAEAFERNRRQAAMRASRRKKLPTDDVV
jgi:hypothetical protein